MRKKGRKLCLAALCAVTLTALCACGKNGGKDAAAPSASAETMTEAASGIEAASSAQPETEAESKAEAESPADAGAEEPSYIDDTVLRVGSLKGPTTMGLVNMIAKSEAEELPFIGAFTMATTADELTSQLVSGNLDIALIPANLASVLYHKTGGGIAVLDVNTLGVLYGITGDPEVTSLSDLKGKTVYMTGQGTTPEFAFNYILAQNGIQDEVKIEFKNEAAEIAALLAEDPMKIAVLPQPFATVTMKQNEAVKEFLNLTGEWEKCPDSGESRLLTGVTVVRKDFLAEHQALVAEFVLEHEESTRLANEKPEETAELVALYGIIEKAPIAKLALPKCNIVCLTQAEMKGALSGYLEVLHTANPKSVGGALPGDDFYAFAE